MSVVSSSIGIKEVIRYVFGNVLGLFGDYPSRSCVGRSSKKWHRRYSSTAVLMHFIVNEGKNYSTHQLSTLICLKHNNNWIAFQQ